MNKYGIGLGMLIVLVSGACFSCGCVTQPTPEIEYVEVVEVVEVEDVVEKNWENYYNQSRQIPYDQTVMDFLLATWTEENQYEMNAFDCSQMSTYMEWALENSGVDTVIWIGDSTGDGELDHAWLGINLDGDGIYYSYEPTGCYWHAEDELFPIHYEFEDIYELWNWCEGDLDYFYQEFGWWI